MRSCKARVITLDDAVEVVRGEHDHAPCPAKNKAQRIVSQMRKRAREEVQTVPTIYRDALQTVNQDGERDAVAAQLPTFSSVKSSLYRSRQKKFPTLPRRREDINLDGEWSQTQTGENFVAHHVDDMIIFTTDENLRRLSSAKTLFMDGTFEMCPRIFYQIFTIHTLENGQQFPMVYCLLPGKSREIYNRVFIVLKERLQNLGLDLAPEHVMSDFDMAIVNAVQINFPTTLHKGCYYHFRQAIWRKIQALGLQQQYAEDASLREMICKTAAIAFVPLQFVRPAWDGIAQELEKRRALKVSKHTSIKPGCEEATSSYCGITTPMMGQGPTIDSRVGILVLRE